MTELLNTRRTETLRHGEHLFVPTPYLEVPTPLVLSGEDLTGRGLDAHRCDEAFHVDGGDLLACRQHPRGLTAEAHARLLAERPETRRWNWRRTRVEPRTYVRGRVTHPRHGVLELPTWHRVEDRNAA
ncbi:MAG: hypothetical protein AAF533_06335 [Acidobacteriota bacterium]